MSLQITRAVAWFFILTYCGVAWFAIVTFGAHIAGAIAASSSRADTPVPMASTGETAGVSVSRADCPAQTIQESHNAAD